MSDPTQHSAPRTSASRRWLPTYQQWRLGVLMSALVMGITGMSRHDDRMVNGAIGLAIIGVVMRIVGKLRQGQG